MSASRRVLALLAAAGLVAGCGGLPTDTEVTAQRPPNVEAGADQPAQLVPQAPEDDATPEEIVDGFLTAQANAEGGHAVAREYLTAEARRAWRDEASVQVYVGTPQITSVGPGRVRVTVQRVAIINRDGSYTPAPGPLTFTFLTARIGSVVRLSGVPGGLWLRASDIGRSYSRQTVYYLAPGADTVVPDTRLLSRRRIDVARALVETVLGPASPWLRPAVATAFPAGTRLLATRLSGDGVLDVDLSAQAAGASAGQRRRMSAQVVWTLAQVPEVRGVRLRADGNVLAIGGSTEPQTITAATEFDPDVVDDRAPVTFRRTDGTLAQRAPDGRADEEPRPRGEPAGLPSLGLPAVSPVDGTIAGVQRSSADRSLRDVMLVRPDGTLAPRVRNAAVTDLSWGSGASGLFLLTARGQGRLYLAPADGGPVREVALPVPPSMPALTELAVSRDGTRVAVIAGSGAGSQLLMGVLVQRDDSLQVANLRRLPLGDLAELSSLVWDTASSVSLLAADVGGKVPYRVQVDGYGVLTPTVLGNQPGPPVAIAWAPDRPMIVEFGDGGLWRLDSLLVTRLTDGSSPAYPG